MSKISRIIFVTFILLLFPVICEASCNILIDGEELICYDANGAVVSPFVYEGTTYVPVRAIAEAFDTTVSWDQATKTVHLGSVGGSPALNDYINIYVDGNEFIPHDVNSNRVYPILKDSTTFLPIRGVGQLFGKNISWDNVTKTVSLSAPPATDELNYLKSAVINTDSLTDLTAFVSFEGSLSYLGSVISTVTDISTEAFSLSAYVPDGYENSLSYLGEGKYFITAPSEKFSSDPYLYKVIVNRNTPTEFSSLYIYVNTKNGYITDISITLTGILTYNGLTFDEKISINATMQYPEDFKFPLIPYPDRTLGDNEESISADAGKNSDSVLISELVESYIDYAISADGQKLLTLLHPTDYDPLFSHKSSGQVKVNIANMQRKLSSLYQDADGTYTLDTLVYIDAAQFSPTPQKAAKAVVSVAMQSRADETEILLIKRDDKWYLAPDMIKALMQ